MITLNINTFIFHSMFYIFAIIIAISVQVFIYFKLKKYIDKKYTSTTQKFASYLKELDETLQSYGIKAKRKFDKPTKIG